MVGRATTRRRCFRASGTVSTASSTPGSLSPPKRSTTKSSRYRRDGALSDATPHVAFRRGHPARLHPELLGGVKDDADAAFYYALRRYVLPCSTASRNQGSHRRPAGESIPSVTIAV